MVTNVAMTGHTEGFPGVADRRWWVHPDEPRQQAAGDEPVAAPQPPPEAATLDAEHAECDRRLREAQARERQAVLELDRARARLERDARKDIERSRRDLIVQLLPVLDDLDRAIAAAHGESRGSALLTGVELVRSGFLDRLRGMGVERFDATGERFDPSRHEAVSTVEARDSSRDGFIVKTLRPGYSVGREAIRPAQVMVMTSRVHTPVGW